ncbi:class II fumarate hydratase [Ferrimonas gelatinilytica]|uniref:Class II fumarate hydratase n=1 Tax=Ferrimonas gelatinilytica TaxID=1255257 RepID=A0ABP9RUK9_9GAMM
MSEFREEEDALGLVRIPIDALHGPQTQRALDNLPFRQSPLPQDFIDAILMIKLAAARSHGALNALPQARADAIARACQSLLADPQRHRHFPLSRFQTGSATSSHMNVNEVIATLASQALGSRLHPNDDVNLGQSSNDVVPSAIHISCHLALQNQLLPALDEIRALLVRRSEELHDVIKTGRTHLMDALPIRFSQCLRSWECQLAHHQNALQQSLLPLAQLPLGGTAVGTGINAPVGFRKQVHQELSQLTNIALSPAAHPGALISALDPSLTLSGDLKGVACALVKISNDLRWMNSGPNAGIGEIQLPELQPGSSIMPGKVNPVVPEAVLMAASEVIGNDTTVTLAGQSGNFELTVMLPLVAEKLLGSIALLTDAVTLLNRQALARFSLRHDAIEAPLARNPILVTALAPHIGYSQAAKIAKTAQASGRPILEVAREMTDLESAYLEALLSPEKMVDNNDAADPETDRKPGARNSQTEKKDREDPKPKED